MTLTSSGESELQVVEYLMFFLRKHPSFGCQSATPRNLTLKNLWMVDRLKNTNNEAILALSTGL